MDINEFRFITIDDIAESKWIAWSRVYEYPYVLNKLNELGANNTSFIHNTSWGFEGCHVLFKEKLDSIYNNCIHSDIKHSSLEKTMYYDITKSIDDKFKNYFDFVINVSTIEEVGFNNVQIIKNLLEQVKPGGYLICTFDYNINNGNTEGCGSINLPSVSAFVNKDISNLNPDRNINGSNSIVPNFTYTHLRCGALVIKKA